MKSTTIVLGSLLAAAAIAQPHRQHAAKHNKRERVVVWETEIAYTTEVVAVTETIWVSDGFVPPSATEEAPAATVPAEFFQPADKPATTSSTSSVYVAPAPVSTPVKSTPSPKPTPEPTPEPPTKAAPVEPSTSPTPEPVAPTAPEPVNSPEPTPEPVTTPPAQTTTAVAAVVAPAPSPVADKSASKSGGSSSGSSSGECSSGSPCEGDITHYETGLGACGDYSTDADLVMALPHGIMGTQSNSDTGKNPYCGRKVTVKLNGKSTTVTVVDKCMGCTGYSIDLSNAAFTALADMGVGRTQASWYFSD